MRIFTPTPSGSTEKTVSVTHTLNPAILSIVQNALLEDLGQGDATTDSLPELAGLKQRADIVTRQACVVSGLEIAKLCFALIDSELKFSSAVTNGTKVKAGTTLATIEGSMSSILKGERTALNFLQHLSGIATKTRTYAEALAETKAKITNTRKTTPGLRLLERDAVVHGGGSPHRYNLGSCVMIKDNHWQALAVSQQNENAPDESNAITNAIRQIRQRISHTMKIEVEVDRLEQIPIALEGGADIILLDNMTPVQIKEAVAIIGNRAITEASGGITLDTVRDYGLTGVNFISTSQITLGVPAIDIGLDLK